MPNTGLKGQKICVTGATGFLGSHLLPKLAGRGAHVTCLCRDPARAPAGCARVIKGDLASGEGVAEAVMDQDIVIHMAALLFGLKWQDYLSANTIAAQHLARAMAGGHGRMIYLSSLAAAGPSAAPPGKNESDPATPVSAYGWSKLLCENILSSALKKIVILRPPIIYGSGDQGLLPLFRGMQKGFAPSPGYGRVFPISAIHADDVANAILLACAQNTTGTYHLNDGETHTMDSFCMAMGRALGQKNPRVFHVPLPVMGISAAISSFAGLIVRQICAITGIRPMAPPKWNLDKYRESVQAGWLADATRARIELGFTAKINLDQGMAEAVAGYRAKGLLK